MTLKLYIVINHIVIKVGWPSSPFFKVWGHVLPCPSRPCYTSPPLPSPPITALISSFCLHSNAVQISVITVIMMLSMKMMTQITVNNHDVFFYRCDTDAPLCFKRQFKASARDKLQWSASKGIKHPTPASSYNKCPRHRAQLQYNQWRIHWIV